MDYSRSQDYHQGQRSEREGLSPTEVDRELTGMEQFVRALEDSGKRLEHKDAEFTEKQQERYEQLRGRLYELTK